MLFKQIVGTTACMLLASSCLAATDTPVEVARLADVSCPDKDARSIHLELVRREYAVWKDSGLDERSVVLTLSRKDSEAGPDATRIWRSVSYDMIWAHPNPHWAGALLCDKEAGRVWLFFYSWFLRGRLSAYQLNFDKLVALPELDAQEREDFALQGANSSLPYAEMKLHDAMGPYERLEAAWIGDQISLGLWGEVFFNICFDPHSRRFFGLPRRERISLDERSRREYTYTQTSSFLSDAYRDVNEPGWRFGREWSVSGSEAESPHYSISMGGTTGGGALLLHIRDKRKGSASTIPLGGLEEPESRDSSGEIEEWKIIGDHLVTSSYLVFSVFALPSLRKEKSVQAVAPRISSSGQQVAFKAHPGIWRNISELGDIVVVHDVLLGRMVPVFPEASAIVTVEKGPFPSWTADSKDSRQRHHAGRLFWSPDDRYLLFFCRHVHSFTESDNEAEDFLVVVDLSRGVEKARFIHKKIPQDLYLKAWPKVEDDRFLFEVQDVVWHGKRIELKFTPDSWWVKKHVMLDLPLDELEPKRTQSVESEQ